MFQYLLVLLLCVHVISGAFFDSSSSESSSSSSSSSSESKEGHGSSTNSTTKPISLPNCDKAKEKCPKTDCPKDPAVIHGFCCGCPSPIKGESPYLCPLLNSCPGDKDELCQQFIYILTCCCPEGILVL